MHIVQHMQNNHIITTRTFFFWLNDIGQQQIYSYTIEHEFLTTPITWLQTALLHHDISKSLQQTLHLHHTFLSYVMRVIINTHVCIYCIKIHFLYNEKEQLFINWLINLLWQHVTVNIDGFISNIWSCYIFIDCLTYIYFPYIWKFFLQ